MYEQIDAYVHRLINESTPERTVWNIEKIREGKPANWNYIDGCMITALLSMAEITHDQRFFDFAENFIDHFVQEDGSILTYSITNYNLDDINEGRVLFELYEKTGKEKYRLAADHLRRALSVHPRPECGNFWHKLIYPNQVWLDGIYMAQVFYALYELHFGSGSCADTIRQIKNVEKHMKDPATGLYFHGYDVSKTAFWADPETGCSKNFWLRSLGWFCVALADLCEILPEDQRAELVPIYTDLMKSLTAFQDEATGMYWQVPNMPGREGNYLETSGSSMIAYAMLKGARLGFLPKEYAVKGQKTFNGIVEKNLSFTEDENGETKLNLGGICLVAGLGPENNRRRDGSYEYYISEPIVENDAKGVAPFLLAYTEVVRLSENA